MLPEMLRPYFWDTDFARLDYVEHRRFIAERLMDKTTPETFHWLLEHFDPQELEEIVCNSRQLSRRDRAFWTLYLASR